MDVNKFVKNYSVFRQELKKLPKTVLPQIAKEGLEQAKTFAPVNSGALRDAIVLQFKQYNEIWIVSRQPKKQIYTGVNYTNPTKTPQPYHIWIETGYQPSSEGQFMGRTAQFLSDKFAKEMNLQIQRIITKVGKG